MLHHPLLHPTPEAFSKLLADEPSFKELRSDVNTLKSDITAVRTTTDDVALKTNTMNSNFEALFQRLDRTPGALPSTLPPTLPHMPSPTAAHIAYPLGSSNADTGLPSQAVPSQAVPTSSVFREATTGAANLNLLAALQDHYGADVGIDLATATKPQAITITTHLGFTEDTCDFTHTFRHGATCSIEAIFNRIVGIRSYNQWVPKLRKINVPDAVTSEIGGARDVFLVLWFIVLGDFTGIRRPLLT